MDNFLETYSRLKKSNLHLLRSIYSDSVTFIDPVHRIDGLDNLTRYFEALYQNIDYISFEFRHSLIVDASAYVQWDMTYSHKKIKKGARIVVPGASYLQFDDMNKVIFHRDYFDLGSMIYEHLPLLGKVIAGIKGRLSR